jgi:tetratricopeptide (TPR) repeat protein
LGPNSDQERIEEIVSLLRDRLGSPRGGKTPHGHTEEPGGNWNKELENPRSQGTGCLSAMEIAQLALGLADEEQQARGFDHIAACSGCSERLREAKEDLERELTAEESAVLQGLESGKPAWQARLSRPLKVRPAVGRRWIWAAAAAVLAAAAGTWWVVLPRTGLRGVERLLAEAYTAGRPFELRVELPGYAAIRQLQGGGRPALEKPAALLDAESRLAKAAHEGIRDKATLRMSGLTELLDGNAEAAVTALEQASSLDAGDAGLKAELGAAWAMRAEQAGPDQQMLYYSRALEWLSQAIQSRPNDPVSQFNIAIVNERISLYDEAIRHWQEYLALDGNSAWSEEARGHLRSLEQKKKPASPR